MQTSSPNKVQLTISSSLVLLLVAVNSVVIFGWLNQQFNLTTFSLGGDSMKLNTALNFILLGIAVIGVQIGSSVLRILAAGTVVGISVITLAEYFLGWDAHIDQLVAPDYWGSANPGRMAPGTALCFIIGGFMVVTHKTFPHKHIYLYDNLLTVFLTLPLFGTFAHIFAPEEVNQTPLLKDMPFHTCLCFILFFFSLSFVTNSKGAAGLLTRQSRHATNFRSLFFLVLILPLTLGSILRFATQEGWIGAGIGIAIFSLFATMIISAALAHHTIVSDHWVKQLLGEKRKTHLLQQQIHELIEIAADGVLLFDGQLHILHANTGAERILGYSRQELTSMYLEELLPEHMRNNSYMEIDRYIQNSKSPASFSIPNHIKLCDNRGREVPVSVTLTKKILSGQPLLIAIIKNMSRLDGQLKSLEKKVFTDPLTMTLNRAAFQSFSERISIHELRKSDVTFCVILMDIDDFKSVNDRYGHEGGDQVLIHFAKMAKSVLRNGDRLYRTGGEEFIVITANLSDGDAMRFAERLRLHIANNPARYDNQEISVTCSIGVCVIDSHRDDLNSAVRRADEAMYQAKNSGKNQVVLASLNHRPSHTMPPLQQTGEES